jgi:hypothetical protein
MKCMYCLLVHYLMPFVETKHSLKDALNQTGLRNQQNTSDKTSEKCRSPKFVSPFKSQGTFLQTYTQIIVFSCLPLAMLQ